jgi:hypothetical protein
MNTPIVEKKEADKKDFLVVRNKKTLDVLKVVAPHEFQVGFDNYQPANMSVNGNQFIAGNLTIKNGCRGSLKLPGPGRELAVKPGPGINVIDNNDDTIRLAIDDNYIRNIDLDIRVEAELSGGLLCSMSNNSLLLSLDRTNIAHLTGSIFTGPVIATTGLSGSLLTLADGVTSYLKAGAGILITTSSMGQVEISIDSNNATGTSSQFGTELVMNADLIGDLNGINKSFELESVPSNNSFMLWLNGQLLTRNEDYTLSGKNVTLLTSSPDGDDIMKALYSKSVTSKYYAINIEPSIISIGESTTQISLQYAPDPVTSLMLFLNGQLLTQGNNGDYNVVGVNVSLARKLLDDDVVRATYSYSI